MMLDTLYYSCANHTGMGGTISVYTDPVVADPYAANCRVAMPISASKNRAWSCCYMLNIKL